jgi:hypothetical protein
MSKARRCRPGLEVLQISFKRQRAQAKVQFFSLRGLVRYEYAMTAGNRETYYFVWLTSKVGYN